MSLVFACLRDKPLAELAQILFPLFEQVIFPPIQSPRATPVEELLAAARSTGTPALVAGSVAEALALAAKRPGSVAEGVGRAVGGDAGRDFSPGTSGAQSRGPSGPETCPSRFSSGANVVVISGSVYLVGEARTLLMSNTEHKQEAPA
jgi:hypothetical protein